MKKKPGLYRQPCGGDAAPGEALLQKLGKRSVVLGCCARSASSASRSLNTATVQDAVDDARNLRLTAAMRGRRARWEGVLERLQSSGATRILCHPKCAALLYKLQRVATKPAPTSASFNSQLKSRVQQQEHAVQVHATRKFGSNA